MNATIGISSPLLSNLRPHSSRLASPSPRCCPRWTPSRPSTHTSRLASTPPKKVGSFDPSLLLCDVVGIWATSFASERVPISTGLPLLVIQIGTWVLVSLLRGDYIRTGLTVDNPSSQLDFALGFPFSQVTRALLSNENVVSWISYTFVVTPRSPTPTTHRPC